MLPTLILDHCCQQYPANASGSHPAPSWRGRNAACPASPADDPHSTWLIDDGLSNSYRALRVINATADLMYTEFVGYGEWFTASAVEPNEYELFDLSTDPHQQRNLYKSAPAGMVAELHARLAAAYECGAKDGAPSDCL